jgi:cold shock CspA family protein
MKVGFVDYWNRDRGFGWTVSDNIRYFTHITNFIPALPPGFLPQAGLQVEFEEGKNSRGLVAMNVRIVRVQS